MADGPNYKVAHRRRREDKTDYAKRLELLKSGVPRVVVRKSNNQIRVQFLRYDTDGDTVIASARSTDLEALGWDHHPGNLPAAYLTGLLGAERAADEGVEEAVVDLGIQNNQHGTRIFAAINGIVDGYVEVPADDDAFPDQERIRGEHIDAYHDNGITETFETVQEKILSE